MVCHAGIAADNSPLQRRTLLSNSWALFDSVKLRTTDLGTFVTLLLTSESYS